MNIINLFKNNLCRILTKKAIIIIAVGVIPVMIGVDVLFSQRMDGTYEVTTIKNKADKKMVESLFKGSKILESNENKDAKRGIGTNILGFILMIILMQGVALITLHPEDRTLKTFRRVLTAPVSEKLYLFVQ